MLLSFLVIVSVQKSSCSVSINLMSFFFVSLESQSSFPTAEDQVSMFFDSVKNRKEGKKALVAAVYLQCGFCWDPYRVWSRVTYSLGLRKLDFSVRNSRAGLHVDVHSWNPALGRWRQLITSSRSS